MKRHLKAGFQGFLTAAYANVLLPRDQERDLLRAFMGGALIMYNKLMELPETDDPTPEQIAEITQLATELVAELDGYAKRVNTPEEMS